MERRLVDARMLAAVVGVSARMVLRLAERGQLPHYRIGRLVRFDVEEALAALSQSEAPR
jgi:excisionase family DNA binding protein